MDFESSANVASTAHCTWNANTNDNNPNMGGVVVEQAGIDSALLDRVLLRHSQPMMTA